jgi:hypothetical protein
VKKTSYGGLAAGPTLLSDKGNSFEESAFSQIFQEESINLASSRMI